MKCASCDGVAHPATGCAWSPKTLICGPCTRRFWAWMMQHTRARKGKPSFYDAALLKLDAPMGV